MKIQGHEETIQFALANLGKGSVFIGYEWLQKHNPEIDWKNEDVKFTRCPNSCTFNPETTELDEPENDDEHLIMVLNLQKKIHLRSHSTFSTELHAKAEQNKEKRSFKETAPEYIHGFEDVFSKEEFDELPPHKEWDHAIELLPGSKHLDCKVYPLNPEEQRQLDEFLDENLKSRRIRPSKSPMASPFFFVKKKDGKLRPVQDYRKLNEMTVKN
jgi:hypothetical protein